MTTIQKYGVDVSAYQPSNLDYIKSLYNAGARFLIAKLTEGTSYQSPVYDAQIVNADKLGMLTAGYHFAHFGGNEVQAVKEGDFAVDTAKTILIAGSIIALDYEADASSSISTNTTAVKTFMRVVKNRGYVPMIYSYKPYFDKFLDLKSIIKEFGNCVWIAGYPDTGSATPAFDYFPSEPGVQIWQFDNNWKGLGVDGNVLIGDWIEKEQPTRAKKTVKKVVDVVKKSTNKNNYATFRNVYVLDRWVQANGKWYVINNDMSLKPIDYNNYIPASAVTLTDTHGKKLVNQNGQGNNGELEFFILNGQYKVLTTSGNAVKLEIDGEPVWLNRKYVTLK